MVSMCRSVLIAASLLAVVSMMSTIIWAADPTRSFADIAEGGHDRQSHRFNDNPHNNWPVQHRGQSQSFGHQQNPSLGTCSTNYGLNYLRFSIQWGPGYCSTSPKRCQIVEPVFTIHGMWPQVSAEKNLEHCCGDSEFDLRKVDDTLLGAMNKYWFSYFSHNSRGFWNHQWRKHGTCAREVAKLRGQELYFGTTIDKMKSLDLQGTLYRDNIRPGPDKGFVYPSSDIVESLKKRTGGKEVRIDCDYQHDDRIPILTGISVCLDKNLGYINCPFSGNKCRRQVYFRAFAE